MWVDVPHYLKRTALFFAVTFLISCLGGFFGCRPRESEKLYPYKVKKVVDGDTLVMTTGEKVRLIGVDTPEIIRASDMSSKAKRDMKRLGLSAEELSNLGQRSKAFLEDFFEMEYQCFLVFDEASEKTGFKDKYKRLLSYIYIDYEDKWKAYEKYKDVVDGRELLCLNALLVAEGYAKVFRSFPFKNKENYMNLEKKSKKDQKGLWAIVDKL